MKKHAKLNKVTPDKVSNIIDEITNRQVDRLVVDRQLDHLTDKQVNIYSEGQSENEENW